MNNIIKDFSFESERLITECLMESDASTLFRIYSDFEAMKYRGSKPMTKIEDAHKMIAEKYVVNNQISKSRLGIKNKSDHQLIGTLLLVWDEKLKDQCEIGFSFEKNYWNMGYGKETLNITETQLRMYSQIQLLKAWCVNENLASIRIFEKAGFSEINQSDFPKAKLFMKKL